MSRAEGSWSSPYPKPATYARDGRVIQYELAGFETPQVVVHSIVRSDFIVLPVAVAPGSACTVSIEREASAFELMLRLEEEQCSLPRTQRFLLTRGHTSLYVNNEIVTDVFQRDALLLADSAFIAPSPAKRMHSVAETIEPLPAEGCTPHGFCSVHRPGMPPTEVHLPPHLPLSGVRAKLVRHGLLHNAGHLNFPDTVPGGGPHMLALTREQTEDESDVMIFDLRRVAHPPLVTFWTSVVIVQADTAQLQEFLHEEFPTLSPSLEAFVGCSRFDNDFAHGKCTMVTVVGLLQDPSRAPPVIEPAVYWTLDLLKLRPGLLSDRSRYIRRRGGAGGTTRTTTCSGVDLPDTSGTSTTTTMPAQEGTTHPCAVLDHCAITFTSAHQTLMLPPRDCVSTSTWPM